MWGPQADTLIMLLAVAAVAVSSIVLSVLAYWEARRARMLLEATLGAARLRELARIRRELASRPRRRYIVFSVVSEREVGQRILSQELTRAARSLLGSSFIADSGFSLVYFNPATQRGVIRVRSRYKHAAIAVLSVVRSIGGRPAVLLPVRTSGTLRKAREVADR